jgi:hypothetical protein
MQVLVGDAAALNDHREAFFRKTDLRIYSSFFCQLYENIKCFFYLAANSILSENTYIFLEKFQATIFIFQLPA